MSNKVIAAISFKEPQVENVQDTDYLFDYNQKRDLAIKHINSMISFVQGKIIGRFSDYLFVECEVKDSHILRDIHDRLDEDLNMINSVGVGETLEEAKIALQEAEKQYEIKVFHPDMDEEESRDQAEEPSVAFSEETEPIVKSEEVDEPISEDTKAQLATIIDTLRQNKEYTEQLKQTNPDAYQAIIELVQSLSRVAEKAKEKHAKKKIKEAEKILRLAHEMHEGQLNEEEMRLIEALSEAQQEQKQKTRDRIKAQVDHGRAVDKAFRQKAKEHSEVYGLDPKFLTGLQWMLRRSK